MYAYIKNKIQMYIHIYDKISEVNMCVNLSTAVLR